MAADDPGVPASRASQRAGETAALPSEAQVFRYLERNPDILQRSPHLARILAPPVRSFNAAGGGVTPSGAGGVSERDRPVVEIQRFIVAQLREALAEQVRARTELLAASRRAEQTRSGIHKAVSAVLGARSFAHFIEIMTTDLVLILGVDVVALCVEHGRIARVTPEHVHLLPMGAIAAIMATDDDVVLAPKARGRRRIYGSGAGLVHSEALLRLRLRTTPPHALLAVGSRTSGHFGHGTSREAYGFLGDVLRRVLRQWLDLPK